MGLLKNFLRIINSIYWERKALKLLTCAKYPSALPLLEKALKSASEAHFRLIQATCLTNIGAVYETFGDRHLAIQYYHRSLDLADYPRGKCDNLINIGVAYTALGEYQNALQYLLQALDIAHTNWACRDLISATLQNIGAIYGTTGQHEDALHYFHNALAAARKPRDQRLEARIADNLALIYSQMGKQQEASTYWSYALRIVQETGDLETETHIHHNLGTTYLETGQLDKALSHYQRSLTIASEIGDQQEVARVLCSLGRFYKASGHYEQALQHYTNSLKVARRIGDRASEGRVLQNIGGVIGLIGGYSWKDALRYYEESIGVFETVRYDLVGSDMRIGVSDTDQSPYANYIQVLMFLYNTDSDRRWAANAFLQSERRKARALIDLLSECKVKIRQGVDDSLLDQERRLSTQILNVQKCLMEQLLAPIEEQKDIEIAQLRSKRDALDLEYRQLQAIIHKANSQYKDLVQPEVHTLAEVQERLLDDNTAVLEYSLTEMGCYLWVVKRDTFDVYELRSKTDIEEQVHKIRAAILDLTVHNYNAAYELYCMLVQPAENILKGNRLVIVPDGILHYLPFELLLTHSPKDMESFNRSSLPYLLRRHAVIYAPSASALILIRSQNAARSTQNNRRGFIAFADPVAGRESRTGFILRSALRHVRLPYLCPLPATRIEAEGIARLFGNDNATLKLGEEATKRAVLSAKMKEYRYVHFATHGLCNEEKPQFSGLVLSPDAEDDGFLQTFEVFNIELNADMVVLSACQTGLGKIVSGEGVVGLARAFMYAGTPTVCVSLWNVGDESTAELMQKFYEQLITRSSNCGSSIDKAEALRQAKLEMIQGGQWSSPHHWAPFILMGDWT